MTSALIIIATTVFVNWPFPETTIGFEREYFVLAAASIEKGKTAQEAGDMQAAVEHFDGAVEMFINGAGYAGENSKKDFYRKAHSLSNSVLDYLRATDPESLKMIQWEKRASEIKAKME